jgi:hypothetical protein
MKDLYSKLRRTDNLPETSVTQNHEDSIVSNKQTQEVKSTEIQAEMAIISKYALSSNGSLRQGEILSNLKQYKFNIEKLRSGENFIEPIIHPFAVVITQDCDCEQDFKVRQNKDFDSDKIIPSILFCELVPAELLRNRDKGKQKVDINSKVWDRIKINKDERYHFLEATLKTVDMINEGLPEFALDFKRYFTIPTEEVYYRIEIGEAKRRSRLVSPYLEHLTSRFNYFQSRIALPEDHTSI